MPTQHHKNGYHHSVYKFFKKNISSISNALKSKRNGDTTADQREKQEDKFQEENKVAIEANRIAEKANEISRTSYKINSGLLIVTAALAVIAVWQGKSAGDAAKTA